MVIGNWTNTLEKLKPCESYTESAQWVGTSYGRSRREREECTRHGAAFQRHEEAASSYSAVVIVGFEGQGLPS